MSMVKIPKFPKKMSELLGDEGRDEFIDFLNDSFQGQREDIVQITVDRFEKRVVKEVSGLGAEIKSVDSLLREEMHKLSEGIQVLRRR